MLQGRTTETATIDRLLDDAREGRGGALVLRGEPGIGKSALLDHAAEQGGQRDMRVLRSSGVESESELPFAAMHLLLSGVLDRIGSLPGAQAGALRRALGLQAGPATGDRFLAGLGVLTLLSELAAEQPVLVVVDDAHQLDAESLQVLLFAARRLGAEQVAVLLAGREGEGPDAPGLPELPVGPLDGAAAELVLAAAPGAAELPAPARALVLREARGNPLALLELPSAQRKSEHYASPYGVACLPAHSRLLRTFTESVAALPPATRTVLLVAAADEHGRLDAVLAAAERLDAGLDDLEAAERARLVTVEDGRVRFRHSVIRAAVYQGATAGRRVAAHRALAEAIGAHPDDPDLARQRAWHLAAAATGPDPEAARLLERSAEHARSRGAFAAVTATYRRSAELTADPAERGRRLFEAASAAADSGQLELADVLTLEALPHLADPVRRARAVRLRALVADEQDRSRDAHAMFTEAAREAGSTDPELAGVLLFQAAQAAWHAGDQQAIERSAERAAALALPGADRIAALARLAAGQHRLERSPLADSAAAVRELLDGAGGSGAAPATSSDTDPTRTAQESDSPHALRETVRTGWWHLFDGRIEQARDLAAAVERRCRETGALGVLAVAQMLLARAQLMLGRHRDALSTATDGLRSAEDSGQTRVRVYLATVLAHLAAVRGDEDACRAHTEEALARGIAPSTVHAGTALALLDLGLGRTEAALDRLAALAASPDRQGIIAALPDLVEAAARLDRPDHGRDAAAWYRDHAALGGHPWAEALALRCRALLTEDPEAAVAHYEEAVRLHGEGGGSPYDLARTRLLYGERLRRLRRTTEARTQLRSALHAFEQLAARPWAERARNELRATGESTSQSAAPGPLDQLTPQELQVARLAAEGLSNKDIGSRLFISPRTAGYHLSHTYAKLGIASRTELARISF
ncbi:LuxR family transcriptional regulator [Kitasatospora phosalacinea]|uniref:LuxR family transcriptional regulator n=1 Tax=Kitasatospora phosalacinea TaxID=2065 RepID=A0A9W6V044_9ACTN|nr:helix-turn-helix transcriptional regulator [Kitasatospora phosalacinea]GLW68883.1 LuxR family transcriptional regulator [Kitasatospora phosalacinea]